MAESSSTGLGLTYWSTRKGPFFWDEYDHGEVTSELAHIADLGCDFVRLLLPWETIQPQESVIRAPALDTFGAVLDAAEHAGVAVVPVLFVGHLFAHRFLPRWLMDYTSGTGSQVRTISDAWEHPGAVKNIYEDRALLDAQQMLVHEVVGNFSQHPAVHAWDIGGNGFLATTPPRDSEAALSRLDLLKQAVGEADDGRHPVWWTQPDTVLFLPTAPSFASIEELNITVGLDTYPFAHGTPHSATDTDFVAYVWLLARTLAGTAVGCSATGVPTTQGGGAAETLEIPQEPDVPARQIPLYDEASQAQYLEGILGTAHALELPYVCNATFADVPEALWEAPPFDRAIYPRYLGLVSADGREKEAAGIWRDRPVTPTRNEVEPRALEVDPEEYAAEPQRCFREWYQRFREGEI